MKSKPSLLYRYPFYLLFLSLYPPLFLWWVNYFLTPAYVIVRPLLLSLGVTVLAFLTSYALFRDLRKSAAVAFLFLVLFFSYGRIYDLLYGVKLFGLAIGKHLTILIAGLAICTAGSVWILRRRKGIKNLTWGLNLVVGFLLLMTVSQLLYREFTAPRDLLGNLVKKPFGSMTEAKNNASNALPDVYYIVLDGYDRQDLMLQDTGLDNRPFVQELENLGFFLPACTQSNYNTTTLSMTATLNMDYLDQLGLNYSEISQIGGAYDSGVVDDVLWNNQVMKEFQALGYKVITFKEKFPFLNFPQSDLIYDYDAGSDPLRRMESTKFTFLFAKTTLLQGIIQQAVNTPDRYRNLPNWVLNWINPNLLQDYSNPLYEKYQIDHYQLDKLDSITRVAGRKLVYAHLTVTHGDFATSLTGLYDPEISQDYAGYKDQVLYANRRILQIVKNLQQQSKTPPVIILQGDHGYGLIEKNGDDFKILNAYYLPGYDVRKIDPGISPVNTFRLILSTYFNRDYPSLPNQSIWVKAGFPDGYQVVAPSCLPGD
jgi:hypothetical protein